MPLCADVERDDRAEVERRDRVHGLVTAEEAHRRGQIGIGRVRRAVVRRHRADQAGCKQHKDEHDKRRAEQLAQAVGQLFRLEGDQERDGEKHRRINKLPHRAAAHKRREHLKRGARRARDGEARADGQIDEQREHRCKARVHPRGERGQAARPRHRDHAQHGQADRAHGKAEEGRPRIGARLRAKERRENQVARAKKHGKQRKAHKQQVPAVKFLHNGLPPSCR